MGVMRVRNYINGEFVESKSNQVLDVVNPATGEAIAQVPLPELIHEYEGLYAGNYGWNPELIISGTLHLGDLPLGIDRLE